MPKILYSEEVETNQISEVFYNEEKEIMLHKTLNKDMNSYAKNLVPINVPEYWNSLLPDVLLFHMHTYFEITEVISGKALFVANNQCIEINTGDILMFNENVPHCWCPDPVDPAVLKVYYFYPHLLLNKNFTEEKYGFLHTLYSGNYPFFFFKSNTDMNNSVKSILSSIYDEFVMKKTAYQLVIISKLLEMSSVLIRYIDASYASRFQDSSKIKTHVGYSSVNTAIDYINSHYLEPDFRISKISQIVSMNGNYFSGLFKKSMGMTPENYLKSLRVSKAVELLSSSNLSVAEIGQLCGYESFSSFYRSFISIMGISPSNYKKTHK